MKRILTIMFAAVLTVSAFAQGRFGPDSAECVKYLSYYTEYMKQGNNAEAIGPWRKAYSLCPVTAAKPSAEISFTTGVSSTASIFLFFFIGFHHPFRPDGYEGQRQTSEGRLRTSPKYP